MESNEKFSWRARGRSFRYALAGLRRLVADEHNSRLHLAAAAGALLLGAVVGLERWEWVAIVGCIAMVIMAEAFNSAIEAVADRFGPERHPLIGKAKDVAAGGVLVAATGALVIGAIIFLGKISW